MENKPMPGLNTLLNESFVDFKAAWWKGLLWYLAMILALFAPLGLAAGLAWHLGWLGRDISSLRPGAVALLALGLLLGGAWLVRFMLAALAFSLDPQAGIGEQYRRSKGKWWDANVQMAASFFVILGGIVFLWVPGIIFGIWLFAGLLILLDRNERPLQALKSSRAMVRGRAWLVFFYLVVFTLVFVVFQALLNLLPVVGQMASGLISIAVVPAFQMIFTARLYKGLRDSSAGAAGSSLRGPMITAAMGWLLIIGFAVLGLGLMVDQGISLEGLKSMLSGPH